MASFEEILNLPASAIKAPEALPVGTYHAMIDGPLAPGKSAKKQTDLFTVKFKILDAMDDVDSNAAAEQQVKGKIITSDYYVTEDAVWRLRELLVDHLGIEPKNASGQEKKLKELIAEAPGQQVLVNLKHEASQDGKRVFHRVNRTAHV